jgi:ribosome-associated translation inhibitor RaiA
MVRLTLPRAGAPTVEAWSGQIAPGKPGCGTGDRPAQEGWTMQVLVNTGTNIEGPEKLVRHVEDGIETSLSRFADRLTRVEVHLADESGGRPNSAEMRCTIETRPSGLSPVAVTEHAATLEDAFRGATQKLHRLLDNEFGRLDSRKHTASIRHASTDEGAV